jgi:hypothetical protein
MMRLKYGIISPVRTNPNAASTDDKNYSPHPDKYISVCLDCDAERCDKGECERTRRTKKVV